MARGAVCYAHLPAGCHTGYFDVPTLPTRGRWVFFCGLPCPLCYAWLLANYCLGCLPKLRFLANCFRAACPLLLLYACPMCLRLLRLGVADSVPNPPRPWTVGVFLGVALSLVRWLAACQLLSRLLAEIAFPCSLFSGCLPVVTAICLSYVSPFA